MSAVMVKTQSLVEQGGTANIYTSGLLQTDTVSATKDSVSVPISWNSTNSRWEITDIGEYGDYVISATHDSVTKTKTVNVDAASDFTAAFTFVPIGTVYTITSGTSFTLPMSGVYTIELHGGGGGGGGGFYRSSTTYKATGGGGGGSGAKWTGVSLTEGVHSCSIGSGGSAGTGGSYGGSSATAGGTGGSTTFDSYTVSGGSGGGRAASRSAGSAGSYASSYTSGGTNLASSGSAGASATSSSSGGSGGSGGAYSGSYGTGGEGGGSSSTSYTAGSAGTQGAIFLTLTAYS